MPIDFPNSPNTGDIHTVGGTRWQYDGAVWNVIEGDALQTVETKTADYTLLTADAGKILQIDKSTAATVTVNGSLDLATGDRIDIIQRGAGQVTVSASSPATVSATPGFKLRAQWSAASLLCVAPDTYVLVGDLTATSISTRCGAIVYHAGAGQSITSGTTTSLSFDSEETDTDGFHSTSSNTGRITIPSGLAGVYSVWTYVRWESNSVTSPTCVLQVNGTAVARQVGATGYFIGQNVAWTGYLSDGDYITTAVYHTTGVARTLDTVAAGALDPRSPTLGAFRVA